ncbi:hypothetical protein BB560_000582 [Smittium megazygosporum]|uniref:Uncharacterized protein n=1 Tax=Smittium megazygosporum TaxID=133381 RepID=A0A2T9ZK48_9FUNG|nr:hypothetical protein BB560_000582 [Smittium megazygosporum]
MENMNLSHLISDVNMLSNLDIDVAEVCLGSTSSAKGSFSDLEANNTVKGTLDNLLLQLKTVQEEARKMDTHNQILTKVESEIKKTSKLLNSGSDDSELL